MLFFGLFNGYNQKVYYLFIKLKGNLNKSVDSERFSHDNSINLGVKVQAIEIVRNVLKNNITPTTITEKKKIS